MQRNCLVAIVFSMLVFIVGLACESRSVAAEETEILKITVGQPTKLSSKLYQNMSTVMVSRTGVVAVIYVKPGREPRYPEKTRRGTAMGYRVSTDRGATWREEMIAPDAFGGGQCSGTLRDGGVIIAAQNTRPSTKYTRAKGWKGDPDPSENPEGIQQDWLDILYLRFADDMRSWQTETVRVHIPEAFTFFQGEGGIAFTKGKMVQLPNGDLLSPMSGGALKGDISGRTWIVRSSDQGRTWHYYATIFYSAEDPNPEFPGHYAGASEPSIALLSNGQMLAMLRLQYAHYPGEYKPMYVCWSNDLGKTWTNAVPTKPQLMNIAPTLQVLDNGVVACEYGRPGFHVAFSLDKGHTWQDRISFSDLTDDHITGQFDMVKVSPNELVTVGSDAEGTKIWPIRVERLKVSPAHAKLKGSVLDQQGNPVAGATIERGPNRYTLDSWLEHETRLGVSKAGPLTVGSPVLGYRSIRNENSYPIVNTDTEGRFDFHNVALGEYVLTVEADGYAPQHRHVNVRPQFQSQDFRLNPGRLVRSKVMDETGMGIPGICVVLNRWHVHTDSGGYFHWSLEDPAPQQVAMKICKRYSGQYEELETTVALSELESQPITLKNR